jgi:hypothetical protein
MRLCCVAERTVRTGPSLAEQLTRSFLLGSQHSQRCQAQCSDPEDTLQQSNHQPSRFYCQQHGSTVSALLLATSEWGPAAACWHSVRLLLSHQTVHGRGSCSVVCYSPHSPVTLLTNRSAVHSKQRRPPVVESWIHCPSTQPSGLQGRNNSKRETCTRKQIRHCSLCRMRSMHVGDWTMCTACQAGPYCCRCYGALQNVLGS